ncbi:unnamed protein product [Rotaria sp. Silwood2]|nr:unnamed protein product [Rotaria sp. Silwood2]CAF2703187.1 unnamed protein product [Rotaria sp. Silwood2]CAF2852902.1 unnamed protein product [Rotaria sp. Silwood2]CAF4108652.1 unnamed protein product [Rotaria sp. Silwood2]CAF4152903.1 unnamed protein product [Rotaria sp. Silwood2]
MTSIASISTAINNIIQRANDLKVYQDHLKLIATNLTRLRQRLNDRFTTVNESHSQEYFAQILKAIDEVVTDCSENENYLNGVTYGELQSVLLCLQYRLAQYEAILTDDYEMRVQILSNACQDQQFCLQKYFDETVRQRLDKMK